MMSVATLLILTCVLSTTRALTEFEWREVLANVSARITKCITEEDYNKLAELFSKDAELLWPDARLADKGGVSSLEEFERGRHPIDFIYFGFLEVLYTSPDVALVTHATYGEERDKGITLLVKEEDNVVRIKLASFNFNRLKTVI